MKVNLPKTKVVEWKFKLTPIDFKVLDLSCISHLSFIKCLLHIQMSYYAYSCAIHIDKRHRRDGQGNLVLSFLLFIIYLINLFWDRISCIQRCPWTYHVAMEDLDHLTFLPLVPQCWEFSCWPPCLAIWCLFNGMLTVFPVVWRIQKQ